MGALTTEFTTFANVDVSGTDWTSLSWAQRVDADNARCALAAAGTSNVIRGSNLLQKLLRNCVATGLVLANTRSVDVANSIKDVRQRWAIGGSVSANKADTVNYWATTETTVTYGGATDLWSLTPSRDNLNATTCAYDVNVTADLLSDASLDAMIPTIHYRQSHMPCRASRAGFAGRGHERAPF